MEVGDRDADRPGAVGQETDAGLEALLRFLKESRGFDFTGYKRATLSRRIRRRMDALQISTGTEYLDRLRVDPEEITGLFNYILINVTSFFRDAAIWDFLGAEVIPRIVEGAGPT